MMMISMFCRKSTCLDDGAAALGAVEAEDTDREGRSMNRGQNGQVSYSLHFSCYLLPDLILYSFICSSYRLVIYNLNHFHAGSLAFLEGDGHGKYLWIRP